MATAAEQWVLVEMVQALYEVSLAARAAMTTLGPGEMGRLLWVRGLGAARGWPGRAGPSRSLAGGARAEARAGAGTEGLRPRAGKERVRGRRSEAVLRHPGWG